MSIKHLHQNIVILSLVLLTPVCDRETERAYSAEELENMTLSSLEKVNDYPLYVMTYYGDYGFNEFLKTGQRITLNAGNETDNSWGCTCFSGLKNENARLLGRNFDWPNESVPLLLFTDPPEGYASVSVVDLGFFGYSRDDLPDSIENRGNLLNTPWMPFDGLNEKGVAIGMMAVQHAESPFESSRVTIGEIEMIRLVLDHADNLDHAISLVQNYNIRIDEPPIHYIITDVSGRSAIVEFYEGEMKILRNSRPWQVSTNFIFSEYDDPGQAGCWRYNRALSSLTGNDGDLTNTSAMELLKSVSHKNTIWSVVYNMSSGDISIATGSEFSGTLYYKLYE